MLGASVVVNGSYFELSGAPTTPIVSFGTVKAPRDYYASHGAFVVKHGRAFIDDFSATPWKTALEGAAHALVSYPLLVRDGNAVNFDADDKLLANRTFVAEDVNGHIVFGTTTTGFFSLRKLADIIPLLDLEITRALNLDGGPAACQVVDGVGTERNFCGAWVTLREGDSVELRYEGLPGKHWDLPIVIAVKESRAAVSNSLPIVAPEPT
jgi:exopolysaccharide biosynthesis protein